MSVIMEDLANYGFDVTYNDKSRTLSAIRDYGKNFNPITNIPDNKNKPGSIAFSYVHTDIKAYLYDSRIESFAINGRLVIYIDDLSDFGSFVWDAENRELRLRLYETEKTETSINPHAQGSGSQAEEIKKLIYSYSPSSTYILTSMSYLTSTPVDDLISVWYWDDDLFATLNTSVHEICHMYTGEVTKYEKIESGIRYITENYEFDKNRNIIFNSRYIIDNSPVVVKYPEQKIKTDEATGRLPLNLRSFRWEYYVSRGNISSANVDGVYGLLDEFHAYYYGCRAVVDCHDYLYSYLDKNGYSEKLILGYLDSILSDILAFYEFKYWTLEYLTHLKEHYPSQYKAIMNNENYKKAFIYIHDNYENLVENIIPQNIKSILDKLNALNIDCSEDSNNIWIGDTGRGKFTKDIELMKKEMSSLKHKNILNELRK